MVSGFELRGLHCIAYYNTPPPVVCTMAVPRRLKDALPLRKLTLSDVLPTGKQLGVGSFGSVEELRVGGAICAGKKIHATLLDPGNQGWQNLVDRFTAECELMSELRHPNLVQFLGLHFYEDSAVPVLVMERLERSLDNFMEEYNSKNIPLSLKTQILFDARLMTVRNGLRRNYMKRYQIL